MTVLIDLRKRIKSIRNTQQITQAMKAVSSAKFKKAQRTVINARPWWHTFPDLIADIISDIERNSHPLLAERKEKRIEGLVITSDKGLAGAFNTNLLEKSISFFNEKKDYSKINLILMGKKAVSFYKKYNFEVDREYSDNIKEITKEDLEELSQFLIRLYVYHRTDSVYVVYNEFKSILAPQVTMTRLLPVSFPKDKENLNEYIFDWEPYKNLILNSLLPLYIKSQICHYFKESLAAEHAARMMAMDNATRNAGDLIGDLTLEMNKIRQASITKELLEIMTAVEALSEE